MESYLEQAGRITVTAASRDRSVLGSFSRGEGIVLRPGDRGIDHLSDQSLAEQLTAVVAKLAEGHHRALVQLRHKRWGTPIPEPVSAAVTAPPPPSEPDVEVASPRNLVKVTVSAAGLRCRVRPGSVERIDIGPAVLFGEATTAVRTAIERHARGAVDTPDR